MSHQSTIASRCAFNSVDTETINALKESAPLIMELLPAVLDSFYEHVSRFPETMAFFRSREHMMHAKKMQLKHWTIIANGRFDESYEASVTAIGEVHNKLGLEPRWYIGGYNFLVAGLLEAIAARFPTRMLDRAAAQRKLKLQTSIVRVAMLDMDYAIAVYLEAGRRDRREVLQKLAGDFETNVGGIVQTLSSSADQFRSAAQTMSATVEEASIQVGTVAAAAEEASANVSTVAAAAEELASSVREISRQVVDSATFAQRAVVEAKETSGKVRLLSQAVQKIGAIVDLISGIASQTNLLALNATIEAARAGDAGRGFAVVAQEVKLLAEQTAKATAEIGSQIGAIQSSTSDAVTAIERIGEVIGSMDQIASSIAAAVEQQGASTEEIARNVTEAAAGTTVVSTNIVGISRATTETGSAATQVLAATSELARQSEVLREKVKAFLVTVRAA